MPLSHTPGPWTYDGTDSVIGPDYMGPTGMTSYPIAGIVRQLGDRNRNGYLIAAAPDMLEALEGIIAVCPECGGTGDGYEDEPCPWCRMARAAIAKARVE